MKNVRNNTKLRVQLPTGVNIAPGRTVLVRNWEEIENTLEVRTLLAIGAVTVSSSTNEPEPPESFAIRRTDSLVIFREGMSNTVTMDQLSAFLGGTVVVDTTAPVITSASIVSTAENVATTINLTANETVKWSKLAGLDAASFTLTGSTLTLPAQDFETKNSFATQIRAVDAAGNAVTQTVTVNITNVLEGTRTPLTALTATMAFDVAAGVRIFDLPALVEGESRSLNVSYLSFDANGDVVRNNMSGPGFSTSARSVPVTVTSSRVGESTTNTTMTLNIPAVLSPLADNVRPVSTAAFDSAGTAQNSLLTAQNGTTLFGLSIAVGETRTFGQKLRDGISGGQGALWLAFGGYGDFTMATAYSTDATDLTSGTWTDIPHTLQAPDGLSGADKFAESGQLVNLPDVPAGAIVRCRITAGSTSVNVSPAVYSSTPEVWAIVGPSLPGISVRTTTLHDDMTAARAGMGPIIIKWCRGAYDGPEVKGLVDEVIRKVPRFTAAFLDIGGNDVSVARPYASDANPTRMASAFVGAVAALKAAGKRIFTGPITYRNYPVDGSKPAVIGLAVRQNGSQPYNVNTMVAPIRDDLPEMWDADLGIWQGDLYDRFLYNWSTVVGADGIHFADGTQYPIYKQDIVRHRNYAKTLVWPAHYLVAQIAARKAAGSQTQEQKDRALAAIADWPAAQNADQTARRNALIADVNGTQVGGATTIFADTFTGTNGDALPGRVPQIGAAWQASGGVIDTNRVRNAGTTTNAQVPTEPPTPDYEVRARIYKAGDRAAQGVFVSARWASENNHYRAGYSAPDGSWIIQKVVGGTAMTIGTTKAATLVTGTNYDIVFKLVGTALKLTVDGVLSCEATDGDLTAKGFGGIKWTGANSVTTTGHHFVSISAVASA